MPKLQIGDSFYGRPKVRLTASFIDLPMKQLVSVIAGEEDDRLCALQLMVPAQSVVFAREASVCN